LGPTHLRLQYFSYSLLNSVVVLGITSEFGYKGTAGDPSGLSERFPDIRHLHLKRGMDVFYTWRNFFSRGDPQFHLNNISIAVCYFCRLERRYFLIYANILRGR